MLNLRIRSAINKCFAAIVQRFYEFLSTVLDKRAILSSPISTLTLSASTLPSVQPEMNLNVLKLALAGEMRELFR